MTSVTSLGATRASALHIADVPTDTTEPTPEPSEEIGGDLSNGGVVNRAFQHSLGVLQDIGYFAGVDTRSEEGPQIKPVNALGFTGLNAVAATAVGWHNASQIEGLTGGALASTATRESFKALGNNTLRVTPTLVSAVLGPAIADGVTRLAPNLIPKYTKKTPEDKSALANVQWRRGAVAGGAVGVLAGITYLIKPDLFKKAGLINSRAVEGFTKTISVRSADVAAMAAKGFAETGQLAAHGTDMVTMSKEIPGMVKDPVFSNRLLLGLVGGVAAGYLLYKAFQKDENGEHAGLGSPQGIAGAAIGAATVAGVALMPRLTRGAAGAGRLAFMPGQHTLFWKPNMEWFKQFGAKVAPLTAMPAYTSASMYFDVFNDFGKITDSKSPFTK